MQLRLPLLTSGLALLSLLACVSACSDDAPLIDDDGLASQPPPAVTNQPRPPPPEPAREEETGAPSRPVAGTLLVNGKVKVVGVTDDGWLAYFVTAPGSTFASFEVFDTKTKKRVSLGSAGSANDTAIVRGKAVALWTNLRAPYGWGGLTVWTEASGVTTAKSASSLPGLFATNTDATRLAFSFGRPPAPPGIMELATSAPTSIGSPQIVATNVGIGDKTTSCIPQIGFHGAYLFTSSCEGAATSGTVRMIDASGAVTTVRSAARPAWSANATGARILVTSAAGDAELHTMPSNAVAPVAANVASAVLSPDGATVVYATTTAALHRAPIDNPTQPKTLLASGAREVLNVSPDGAYAIVASLPADPPSSSTHRTDLHLVALDSPTASAATTALLTTATGMAYGFTRSGSHVLYITDLTGIGFDDMQVRARPVTGGTEIILGREVRGLVQPAGSTKILFSERTANYRLDVKVVDLEKGVAPKVLIDDVESALMVSARAESPSASAPLRGVYEPVGKTAPATPVTRMERPSSVVPRPWSSASPSEKSLRRSEPLRLESQPNGATTSTPRPLLWSAVACTVVRNRS